MYAVVLAGGLGTRVRSITSAPKALLPVAGRPVIDHIIDLCLSQGVKQVLVAAGYRGDMLLQHIQQTYADAPVTLVQESSPQGTAGALMSFRGYLTKPFLLLNGDTLFEADLGGLMAFHEKCGALITMGLVKQARDDAGNVAVSSLPGWVVEFGEKQQLPSDTGLINAGIYAASPLLLNEIRSSPCSLERDILPGLLSDDRLAGFPVSSCYDIGTMDRFREVDINWVGENR